MNTLQALNAANQARFVGYSQNDPRAHEIADAYLVEPRVTAFLAELAAERPDWERRVERLQHRVAMQRIRGLERIVEEQGRAIAELSKRCDACDDGIAAVAERLIVLEVSR